MCNYSSPPPTNNTYPPSQLIEPGSITFTAEVDSEPGFDGLRFELGPNRKVEIPITGELDLYTFNLTAGAHVLRWVYYKDDLWSSGEDMAIISSIEIEGIRYADEKCTQCAPGSFQDQPGQPKCKKCSLNNVPAANFATCQPCPTLQYSFPGDPTCRDRPGKRAGCMPCACRYPSNYSLIKACTADDFEVSYTSCVGPVPGHRQQRYEWVQPQICVDSNHVPLSLSLSLYLCAKQC